MKRLVYDSKTRAKYFLEIQEPEPAINISIPLTPDERLKNIEEELNSQPVSVPIRGTDYWTEADIAEIHNYINAQLGVIENGSY